MTRVKQHLCHTKRPPNNPVDLGNIQIKSAIKVNIIFSKHQIDINNSQKILQL